MAAATPTPSSTPWWPVTCSSPSAGRPGRTSPRHWTGFPKRRGPRPTTAAGAPGDGADVAELTGLLNLTGWPEDTRVIARREVPHPGAQLRLTDHDGRRITCLATNTTGGQLPDLELRHRRRARAEDRIRGAKDTGLGNLPLHDAASNQVWLAIVMLACDLLTWTQTLALTGPLRVAEPKTLRLRLLAIAGRIARTGRRVHLRLDRHWPWAGVVAAAVATLRAIPDRT